VVLATERGGEVPPAVRTAIARFAESPELDRYPDPSVSQLRTALAARHRLPGASLTFGPGSAEIIDRAISLVPPGAHLVVARPCWEGVLAFAERRGVEVRLADSTIDAIARACDGSTALVYASSPSYPLGRSLGDAGELLDRLPARATLLWDEAYVEYGRRPSALALLPRDRLVVVRTFSKIYGLAGFRVGWAAGDTARLIEREPPYPIPAIAEVAAVAALGDEAHLERVRALNEAERARLEDALAMHGIPYIPSEASFVWAGRVLPLRRPEENDRLIASLAPSV
jgi:histidinol-phosphate aminotransferase